MVTFNLDHLGNTMTAKAVLICRPNSHPFQERTIPLNEPVKVGRSVARARPATNNAVFDCKVLSRNHALLWYDNGKFYLQDTKSSNGTFVNNQRLSKGSEESPAREICSGDVVQFGVDVIENSRRVTHGCIVATIKLYLPDGKEAKPSTAPLLTSLSPTSGIPSQELYQLAQYLQEALHREQMLENKLATLQRLVSSTQEASENGWQALLAEDRLLSRLEVLENQLTSYSKNQTEDKLREEIVALQEDKHNYETTAKESLQRVLQEKWEAVRKLSDLERSFSNTEDECTHLKEMCETTQKELQLLAEKHASQLKEVEELQDQLRDAENKCRETCEKAEEEQKDLQQKLEEMLKQEITLLAQIESLQADSDFSKEQLMAMKARMEETQHQLKQQDDDDDDAKIITNEIDENEMTAVQIGIIQDFPESSSQEDLQAVLKCTQDQIEKVKVQLMESENQLQESKDRVEELQNQLEKVQIEAVQNVNRISFLEEKLKYSDIQMNEMVESTIADLQLQLKESTIQLESSVALVKHLQEQICELEEELQEARVESAKPFESNRLTRLESKPQQQQQQKQMNNMHNHIGEHVDEDSSSHNELLQLKELLRESRELEKNTEAELNRHKVELEAVRTSFKKSGEESKTLRTQLQHAQKLAKERAELISDLQDQVIRAETATKDVKKQILELRDRLVEEQNAVKNSQDEAERLRQQLSEAQQAVKQSHNEAEQLKSKVKSLAEELDRGSSENQKEHLDAQTSHKGTNKQTIKNKEEFATLKEECAGLKKSIKIMEADIRTSKKVHLQLSSEYSKLQESYTQLEALKEKLENKDQTWKTHLNSAKIETEYAKKQLKNANDEIATWKNHCSSCKEELTQLRGQLEDYKEDYKLIIYKNKMVSVFSIVPLLLLVFATFLAFYPTLAEITATTQPA